MADNSLKDQAAVIRDETAAGKNTATRVGSLLVDMCDSMETAATAAALATETAERKAADTALTSALATETAAREGGDKNLRADIDANYKLLAGVIDTTIPNEVKERKAADTALDSRVKVLEDAKDGTGDNFELEYVQNAGELVYSATCLMGYEVPSCMRIPAAATGKAGVLTADMHETLSDFFCGFPTQIDRYTIQSFDALDTRVTKAQETAEGLTWLYAVASAECTIEINGTTYTVPARKPLRAALPKGTAAISSFTVSDEAKQYLHALRLTGRKVTVARAPWGYQCAALTSLDLSALDFSACPILASLANGATSLRKLTGYEDWDTSKATNMVYAFQQTALTSLDLSLWDTSACTNMASVFCQSGSLADVGDISQWDTSKVTTISQMFYGCAALTSLDLSSWDLQSCTVCTNAFYGCKGLTTLKLGEGWGKMPGTPTLDLSALTAWTAGWETLGLLYNRAAAGLGKMTIKLPAAVYNGLNEMGLIAYLTQAGYNIAKA